MKKIMGTMLAGCLGFALTPLLPVPSPTGSYNDQIREKKVETTGIPEREFIVRDSVDDPLPPETDKVEAMQSGDEPQTIPNYKYENPIVLTKMPYDQDEEIQPSRVKK
ncbi:MAG TPA: hypothetical protein VFT51_13750 [Bacillales bacterium]|nr:hypothetical protein [Bacillales bacterium]